jgi:curved DNA-binding protein CbpA
MVHGSDDPRRNPWAVLGVPAGTGFAEARRAYRAQCRLLHPDLHQDADPDALAAAQRAMQVLNDAWARVQAYLAGSPASPRPAWTGLTDDPTPEECLAWVIVRLKRAARAHGDPLGADEIVRLRMPAARVRPGRAFDRWIIRRRGTLEQAIDDDAQLEGGLDAWGRAVRGLAEADTRPVVLRVLETKG